MGGYEYGHSATSLMEIAVFTAALHVWAAAQVTRSRLGRWAAGTSSTGLLRNTSRASNPATSRSESVSISSASGGLQPVEIFDFKTRTWKAGAVSPVVMHHFQPVVDQ